MDENNDNNIDNNSFKKRKIYDINELLQTENKKLIKLYLAIKNASNYAYENCDIKTPLNYDIFNEIEKNAIKLEKNISEEKFKYYEDIIKSIKQTENISNTQYIKNNLNSIKNDKEIEDLFDKIKAK